MKTIYKFPLHLQNANLLQMPAGAEPLSVDVDGHGAVCLWALVDPNNAPVTRQFFLVGTGHPVPDGLKYIGSAVQTPFVWHVFEQL